MKHRLNLLVQCSAAALLVAAPLALAAQQPPAGGRRPAAQVPVGNFPVDSAGRIVFRRAADHDSQVSAGGRPRIAQKSR